MASRPEKNPIPSSVGTGSAASPISSPAGLIDTYEMQITVKERNTSGPFNKFGIIYEYNKAYPMTYSIMSSPASDGASVIYYEKIVIKGLLQAATINGLALYNPL